jgi:hypothetical protein
MIMMVETFWLACRIDIEECHTMTRSIEHTFTKVERVTN